MLDACLAAGVRQIIVTSSGAAYGYHADNPEWLTEDDPVRGNEAFAYSHHKRLVEEMLAGCRREHPGLRQVVLRVGTILGETTRNQITALFDRPRLIAMRGSRSPFVFIWDQDVVGVIAHAIRTDAAGIYNVAGDGALSIQEIAQRLGKRVPDAAACAAAGSARVAASARPDSLRARTGRLPAVSSGPRQSPPEGRTRVRAAQDLGRGFRLLLPHPRPGRDFAVTRRSFAGATVVISGAASGLGRALALRFGGAGSRDRRARS